MFTHRRPLQILSVVVILTMMLSGFQLPSASAQGKDGIKRLLNAQTGKVSFIGPESERILSASQALGIASFARPADPAMALAKRFGPEFGLKNPERDLSQIKTNRSDNGRLTTRYQQNYQGVPVIGGGLIVNTNENGDLYSINGEISPDLSLSTQPTIDSEQAKQTAMQSAAKWYQKTAEDFVTSAPELWIYDESLLRPSTRTAELVWRMEVTPKDVAIPVRELVLVNAQRGNISLHFNQIDMASGEAQRTVASALNTTDESQKSSDEHKIMNSALAYMPLLAGANYYVATTGNDSNSCTSTGSPCGTINGAIGKAASGDIIRVAIGTYTGNGAEVVLINKSITISGGWNASFTTQSGISTIDGQGLRRGVTTTGTNVAIDRVKLQNGFHENQGGGLHNDGGPLTLSNSIVSSNVSHWMGGGIFNFGTLTINNTTINNNTIGQLCCGGGGGGGGIQNYYGSVTLNNSTVSGNIIIGGYSGSGINTFDTMTINNSTIYGNTGGSGEGLSAGGTIIINNSTISGNQSYGVVNGGNLTLRNTIIANNGTNGISSDCYNSGTTNSQGYNLIGNTAGCNINMGTGDLANVDPKLGQLVGSPGYLPLLLGSPAINAGNPATCLSTDQRGISRPQGIKCDMGAFEYTTPGTPASIAVMDGSGQRAAIGLPFAKSLIGYVLDGNGSPVPGITITFTAPGSGASGTFADTANRMTSVMSDSAGIATSSIFTANNQVGTYNVTATASGVASSATFSLTNTAPWYVATTGNDSNSCTSINAPCRTINGAINKAAASGDTIKVAGGTYTGTGTEVVLINKSITLSGGWSNTFTAQNSPSIINGQAARRGITTSGTGVIIDRFTIQNGFHNDQGGGIFNSGILTVSNSKVINNNAAAPPSVCCFNASEGGGGIYNFGTLIVNNTTISGNVTGDPCCSAGSGGGGGIFNEYGTLTLNNSLVNANSMFGTYPGSGIYSDFGTVILNNSTVSSNQSGNGDGVYIFGATVFLNNSTISDNQSYGISQKSGIIKSRNTIIARNGVNGDCYSDGGTFTSQGYNLIGRKPEGCAFIAASGDLIGTNASPINPLLSPLQDNGGPTLTHALIETSPAIDAGNPAVPGSGGNTCLPTDQRGVTRPVGTRCDIGAYEGSVAFALFPIVQTYTSNGGSSLPGTFLCNQTDPNCSAGDSHAKAAHKYAIGIYNLYATQHGRDSIDNTGMTIISTVHYCDPVLCPYPNAFWNGQQVVYGDAYGFPLADDVVAHELTHGVTQYESNLFYYYQSGAINESFSDLWGEYYDQTNGQGTDTAGVKWQMGEDVSGLGALRSMSNPPSFGDPDKMSSVNYYEGASDNGGVHTNSGVNNKAVFLMVDGGGFNGKTVTALGWEKTAAIYYEVNTNLLSSGADYSDLYYALQQACSNLIGQKGITSMNCAEVKDAIDAAEMNAQPASNFNTDAPYCNQGDPTTTIFSDGLESGTGNWTFTNGAYPRWQLDSPYGPYAHTGQHFLYADDYPGVVTDASAKLNSLVVPSNAFLHFAHAYDFETSDNYYDGGVLEYSLNGGSSWTDAGSLIDFNGYKGTLFTGAGNPLSGRSAFVGTSHGYISTRVNLTSLAGNTVTFRWRMGLDEAFSAWGWWVDDVEVYQCPGAGKVTLVAPSGTINTQQPTYTWNADDLATWYYLWVDGPSGNILKQWYAESAICSGGICSVTPNSLLSSGAYTWRVQTWNNGGYGPWSDGMNFSVPAPPLPGKANLVSPTGNIGTNNPSYTWNQVDNVTWYYLWVDGPSGNVLKQWYSTAQANCNGSTCSVANATPNLVAGSHNWKVQTWSNAGYGPWSDPLTFAPIPPGKATLVSPTGSIGTNMPAYTWNAVSGATWYYLWVSRVNADGSLTTIYSKWYEATVVCSGGNCAITPAITLNASNYRWWIQTWNSAGYGPWSDRMDFSVP